MRGLVGALIVGAMVSLPVDAHAQGAGRKKPPASEQSKAAGAQKADNSGESPAYLALIDQALAEYERHNFDEARALFARAHEMFPNARTLRGLGLVEFERRNYRASADYLRESLAATVRPLEGELRINTEGLLRRAEGFLSRVQLDVNPKDRARVLVDGVPVELQNGNSLILEIGDHVLEVQAPGYVAERRALSLKGGEDTELRVTLQTPEEVAPPPRRRERDEQPAAAAGGTGLGPWIIVGTSGLVLVAGAVVTAVGVHDYNLVENAGPSTDWRDIKDAKNRAPILTGVGFGMLGVGAAGVTLGLLWHYLWSAPEAPVQVGASNESLTVSGRF